MENKSIIRNFMEKHDLNWQDFIRGLYLDDKGAELFVLESRNKAMEGAVTFVFIYFCGHLVECKTEINTMEKYLLEIPKADFAEYGII